MNTLARPVHPNYKITQNAIAFYRDSDAFLATKNLVFAFALLSAEVASIVWWLTVSIPLPIKFLFLVPIYIFTGLTIAKIFSIQHDCGHNSFFARSDLNRIIGRGCSIFTFIPFLAWKEEHQEHHASFGNIDKQTYGDVLLLTVEQYKKAPIRQRAIYRIFRNPLFLVTIAPLAYALIRQRVPSKLKLARLWSCFTHTAALLIFYGSLAYKFGAIVFLIFLPPLYIAGVLAVVIFVVEHQFEETEWLDKSRWGLYDAAIASSSCLMMPKLLEWFTGNIGYHHIHHLNPRVPSYRLKDCFIALGDRLPCKRLPLSGFPKCLTLALWSADLRRLVTFRDAKFLLR